MQGNEAEIKLKARMLAIRHALQVDEAEYLLRSTNGDDTLLNECLALLSQGIGIATINEWLHEKIGLIKGRSQAYKFCEAVLNLSFGSQRNLP
jgi:hypothetical protein